MLNTTIPHTRDRYSSPSAETFSKSISLYSPLKIHELSCSQLALNPTRLDLTVCLFNSPIIAVTLLRGKARRLCYWQPFLRSGEGQVWHRIQMCSSKRQGKRVE